MSYFDAGPRSYIESKLISCKNNTSIYIVPTPVSTVAGEIQYTKRPLALASATDTSATISNYFSEFCDFV